MSKLKEQYILYKANTRKDPDAFAALYDLYVRQIYRFIFFKVPRREDAEDLTSQAFLKAWQYLNDNKEAVRNFRAFIYELARNLVIDFYRQREKQEKLLFEGEEETLENAGAISDAQESMMLDQDKKDLMATLNKLKEDYQEAIVLKHIEGLSIKEIAQILKRSQIATRVLIHRAMKALRSVIASRPQADDEVVPEADPPLADNPVRARDRHAP